MGKMRWGLIHKIVLFVTIAGVILTLIFVTIERYMVVQLLHGQMDDSYKIVWTGLSHRKSICVYSVRTFPGCPEATARKSAMI